jgi:hypothetical protein
MKQEDAVKKNIEQLETEIATSKEPVRAVLQSINCPKILELVSAAPLAVIQPHTNSKF